MGRREEEERREGEKGKKGKITASQYVCIPKNNQCSNHPGERNEMTGTRRQRERKWV